MSQQLRVVRVTVLQIYFVVVNDKITKHAILARQPVHCYRSFNNGDVQKTLGAKSTIINI